LKINRPYLGLCISIISVSSAAVIIKTVSFHEDFPLTVAFYRLLFTTLLLLPFVIFRKKIRNELLTLSKKSFLIMFIIGLILAAHFAFWITSLGRTSVASSVILVTAHPLLVGPVSHYFLKERLSKANTIGILISVIGVIILVYGNNSKAFGTIDTLEGNILAILGGIAAGLYILGGRIVRKNVSVWSYAIVVYSITTVILFLLCISLKSPIYGFSLKDYTLIFIMAIFAGILGHTLYNWSLEYVRASIASVVLLGEPIGSSILAFLLPWISQIPSEYTILGGAIILFGIYLTARKTNTIYFS
jgi:drug/metabolite transporter (DMT)-like permease